MPERWVAPMLRDQRLSEGWYYKQDGQTLGPVSAGQLRELLATGRLPPRQAVWRPGSQSLRFVRAATAAGRTQAGRYQPPLAEPEAG